MQAIGKGVAKQPVMLSEVIGAGDPLVLVGGGLTDWASRQPHAVRRTPCSHPTGTVRTAALLRAQPPDAIRAIRGAIMEDADRYRKGAFVELPMPAVLVTGRRS